MWIVAIILMNCIATIGMNNRLYSTKSKLFENNTIVCASVNVSLLKAIVIYPTCGSEAVKLKSLNASAIIRLNVHGYLYIQSPVLSRLFNDERCFQIELESRIQFVYTSNNENTNAVARQNLYNYLKQNEYVLLNEI